MTEDEKRALIAECIRIAEIFDEEIPGYAFGPEKSRNGGASGFEKRTTSGLYLEFYYGGPNRLWTPWGRWSFVGSGGTGAYEHDLRERQRAAFMSRLSTQLHSPVKSDESGDYGPVYKVLAVDGIELPPPGDMLPWASWEDGNAASAEWIRLGGSRQICRTA